MNSENPTPIVNDVFDAQMKTLMSIRDFQTDFVGHSEVIRKLTHDLTQVYQQGLNFFLRFAEEEHHKEADELLNNVHVEANQMNQVLTLSLNQMNLAAVDHEYEKEYKDYFQRRSQLKEAALKFESLGERYLSDGNLEEWNREFVVWKEFYETQFERENAYIKLIYDFYDKYSHQDLVRITQILNDSNADEVNWDDPVQFQQRYIKAIQEFQREFKPKNLWDNILEILAGGVHPSPSERIMLQQWTDGEQKTRHDM